MRYQLVDCQGNFGSVDDDPPAAMRYTEARLTEIAEQMLVDIDKDTVNFMPNFDDSLKEPVILLSRLPQLLVNGSSGIAVVSTNIPPHNLTSLRSHSYLIDNPKSTIEDLTQIIKRPDFPTDGILGKDGIRAPMHCMWRISCALGIYRICMTAHGVRIVNELAYQVNKAALIEKMQLVSDKKITCRGFT